MQSLPNPQSSGKLSLICQSNTNLPILILQLNANPWTIDTSTYPQPLSQTITNLWPICVYSANLIIWSIHSPGHWSNILEGQYITIYSHAKQTNDNLWRNIRSAGIPHWLQPRSIYVVPIPTCTAWRLWCRFQEPSATTILNPQQKSPSLMESAMMICSQPSHNQKL